MGYLRGYRKGESIGREGAYAGGTDLCVDCGAGLFEDARVSRYKVAFVISRGCPYLKAQAAVYAVATRPGEAPVLARAALADRGDAEASAGDTSLTNASLATLEVLKSRLPREHEISTYMSCDRELGELVIAPEGSFIPLSESGKPLVDEDEPTGLRVFVIAENSAPQQLREAREAVAAHEAARLAQLRLEYPMLPWTPAPAKDATSSTTAVSNGAATPSTGTALSSDPAAYIEVLQRYGELGLINTAHPDLAPAWSEISRKRRLLLHVCCGPDAAGVINQLKRDFDVSCFWYDPNIQPHEEHDKRLEAFLKVAEIEGVPALVGEYDVGHFYERIRGLEHTPEQGAKCSPCYDMRLERAALEARDKGFDLYATTLAISPHKVQQKLVAFGELNQKKYGVPYFHRNFMRDNGFKRSVELTEQYGIYRQDYCGCYFSLHEGGPQARATAEALHLTPATLKPGYKNPFG